MTGSHKKAKHGHGVESYEEGEAKYVRLRLNDHTSVDTNLFGATVTSYKHGGKDFIFVSEKAVYDNKKPIRGGIPLVFPNFGPWALGPQHGFARNSMWTLLDDAEAEHVPEGAAAVSFELKDSEETRKIWNYKFRVVMSLVLTENSLTQEFKVSNKDEKEFDFTALLHTYFRCEDVEKVGVTGLRGSHFNDKVHGKQGEETRDVVHVKEFTDCVYANTKLEHTITGLYEGVSLTLQKNGFPDTVVWNPWSENAKKMADFGDEEYPNMLCVEAGACSDAVKLSGGATWIASQVITIN